MQIYNCVPEYNWSLQCLINYTKKWLVGVILVQQGKTCLCICAERKIIIYDRPGPVTTLNDNAPLVIR